MDDILRSMMFFMFQNLQFDVGSKGLVRVLMSLMTLAFMYFTSPYKRNSSRATFNWYIFGRPKATIDLVGSITTSQFRTRKHYSKRFLSILHYIQTRLDIDKQKQIRKLSEICVTEVDDMMYTDENKHNVREDLIIDQDETLEIADGIYCKFSMVKDDDHCEKLKIKVTNVTASLISYRHNIPALKDFIDRCVADYDQYLNKKLHDNLYHFVYDYQDEIESFKKVMFKSNKTFDNVFFDDKHVLLKRLNFFETQSQLYKKLGVPHTLGILMHGEPGTGKTSTIKAIANYTRRHLISVPLHKVKSLSSLSNLFLREDIDGVNVPFDKRIYVLEEIDCNGLRDIVKQRSKTDDIVLTQDLQVQLQQLLSPKNRRSNAVENNEITLGGILELIDGLVETPGRIMVVTTNHPENLDAALIRPGRIDINIRFARMTKSDFKEMFKLWFNVDLHDNELLNIKEGKYTHAEVCQMLFQNIDNPKKVLLHLEDNPTQSFQF